jgi:hypothetical protein
VISELSRNVGGSTTQTKAIWIPFALHGYEYILALVTSSGCFQQKALEARASLPGLAEPGRCVLPLPLPGRVRGQKVGMDRACRMCQTTGIRLGHPFAGISRSGSVAWSVGWKWCMRKCKPTRKGCVESRPIFPKPSLTTKVWAADMSAGSRWQAGGGGFIVHTGRKYHHAAKPQCVYLCTYLAYQPSAQVYVRIGRHE